MSIVSQQISNHPIFTDVERYVDVFKQSADSDIKVFEFYFRIRYIKDDEDITQMFSQPNNNRIYTDSSILQLIRNEDFEPIENPDWDGISEDEYDMYMSMNGWDMVVQFINNPAVISDIIRNYIIWNDSVNFFDN